MKAIVIGATGLVGKGIAQELLKNPLIEKVLLFVRRPTGLVSEKLKEEIVSFNDIALWKHQLIGDVLFSALGTTLKAAGSKVAQYRVDYEYQFTIAEAARKNGVLRYVLISSVNSNPRSSFFYLKMKGELEEEIKKLSFTSVHILRPGPLKGDREKSRLSEVIFTGLLSLIPKAVIPAGLIPVEGHQVALVAIKAGLGSEQGVHILGPESILPTV